MRLEWDEKKRQETLALRGLDFADCAAVLSSEPRQERPDNRQDYGEVRWVALGFLEGRLVVILYTKRGKVRRIISMRKANRREKELFSRTQEGIASIYDKQPNIKKEPAMSKKKPKSYVDDQDEVMELDEEWFRTATVFGEKAPRKSISLRVNPTTLEWYRSFGRGYQSRMQEVLEAYANAHTPKKKKA